MTAGRLACPRRSTFFSLPQPPHPPAQGSAFLPHSPDQRLAIWTQAGVSVCFVRVKNDGVSKRLRKNQLYSTVDHKSDWERVKLAQSRSISYCRLVAAARRWTVRWLWLMRVRAGGGTGNIRRFWEPTDISNTRPCGAAKATDKYNICPHPPLIYTMFPFKFWRAFAPLELSMALSPVVSRKRVDLPTLSSFRLLSQLRRFFLRLFRL